MPPLAHAVSARKRVVSEALWLLKTQHSLQRVPSDHVVTQPRELVLLPRGRDSVGATGVVWSRLGSSADGTLPARPRSPDLGLLSARASPPAAAGPAQGVHAGPLRLRPENLAEATRETPAAAAAVRGVLLFGVSGPPSVRPQPSAEQRRSCPVPAMPTHACSSDLATVPASSAPAPGGTCGTCDLQPHVRGGRWWPGGVLPDSLLLEAKFVSEGAGPEPPVLSWRRGAGPAEGCVVAANSSGAEFQLFVVFTWRCVAGVRTSQRRHGTRIGLSSTAGFQRRSPRGCSLARGLAWFESGKTLGSCPPRSAASEGARGLPRCPAAAAGGPEPCFGCRDSAARAKHPSPWLLVSAVRRGAERDGGERCAGAGGSAGFPPTCCGGSHVLGEDQEHLPARGSQRPPGRGFSGRSQTVSAARGELCLAALWRGAGGGGGAAAAAAPTSAPRCLRALRSCCGRDVFLVPSVFWKVGVFPQRVGKGWERANQGSGEVISR